jgi:alanyl-tRNA synthetase
MFKSHGELREKFKKFFESKNHKWVEGSSLLPSDSSVLFTTAGMQQFKPYYTGNADPIKDFNSLNTASIQRSIRTSDIEDVGDESHLTFFEMLGNFSFGGYWKELAITWAFEFITKELGLKIDYVSIFGGDNNIPPDEESERIWQYLANKYDVKINIIKMGRKDNFWGPTGNEGPCGPTTEIYINGIEIWNIVFNEYYCEKDGTIRELNLAGIDTGMGLERLAMVVQGVENIFDTDLLKPIFKLTPTELDTRLRRIITDHSRAIAFLIMDGVRSSNKEQGYILRRLMRRVITYFNINKSDLTLMHDIFAEIFSIYGKFYPNLNVNTIIYEFDLEKEKFEKTLSEGLKELNKMNIIDGKNAFKLYESYGLPFEIIKEIGGNKAKNLNKENFEEEFKKHQEKSRMGVEKKFGGHGLLLDTGELKAVNEEELKKVTRLHTATHLLHASLRKILGEEVRQQGSDITSERLRFDFSFPRKLDPKEIQEIEKTVNEVIKLKMPVIKTEMTYEDAIKSGALAFFKHKYPQKVTVYSIGNFSKELCGGPHVSNVSELGKFKIIKEESVGAGIRRIRAILE